MTSFKQKLRQKIITLDPLQAEIILECALREIRTDTEKVTVAKLHARVIETRAGR